MMGAGVKPGSYGATDDFGRCAVQDVTNMRKFYSIVLHIPGFDFNRLSFYDNGFDRKIRDVHGKVIRQILA